MFSRNRLFSQVKRVCVLIGLVLWITLIIKNVQGSDGQKSNVDTAKPKTNQIVLKVVGLNGEKLSGAKVYQNYLIHNGQQGGREYTCDKDGLVNLAENDVFQYERQRKGIVLYGLYEDKLAGFVDVNANDLNKELTVKLIPACRVYGKLRSTELNKLGQKVRWTNVYVCRGNDRPLSYMSEQGDFEFLLPSGNYELYAYGTSLYGKEEQVEVTTKQKELEKNFDLPADRLAHLIGKEAPEPQKIKGWINSRKIKLADLRGKVVLLDFWGTWCGPCVAAIPELIGLHEKYHDKGLVIIGIHDDSMKSVRELQKKIAQLSEERWKGRKISFAIALDGGGNTPIEGTERIARGATTAAYGIQRWPTVVLIDKQGKIVKEYNHHEDIQLLEKLLASDVDNQP